MVKVTNYYMRGGGSQKCNMWMAPIILIEFTDPHPVLNCILRHDINCTDFASCTSITLC